MSNLKSRIQKLEAAVGAVDDAYPEEPRVAGKPREVALLEHVDWYRRIADHPRTSADKRSQIQAHIARIQEVLGGRSRSEILEGYVEYLNEQLADSPDSAYLKKTLAQTRAKLAALGSQPRA